MIGERVFAVKSVGYNLKKEKLFAPIEQIQLPLPP